MLRLPAILFFLIFSFSLHGVQRFHSTVEESQWKVKSSPIYCELLHPISHYGDGRFVFSSGGELAFQLRVLMSAPRESVASLYSIAPFWRNIYQKELAQLTISKGEMPVYVGGSLALRMLYELQEGRDPTFHYKDWAGYEDDVYVAISSVNFHKQVDKFRKCVSEALPYGAERVKDVTVYFAVNKHHLTKKQRKRLKNIILFSSLDENMRIQLKGYADSRGRKRYNVKLSERRSRAVEKYLISQGVPAEQISYRSFGEGQPVASNRHSRGRTHNRRVEVIISMD
ncbi:hypothetical protein MNBD_GAMMA09-439 [hydrothermal vent metagenome]|uniref:OmpA-like domain-containing protein n=1 Tax=hydrothermal vent metagenome TaxID=652676 RepID=A0A3B0XXR0_9ZZZZ